MIIQDLDIVCGIFIPTKDDPELTVDSNTIKTEEVPRKSFQVIAWWTTQIRKAWTRCHHIQFSQRCFTEIGMPLPRWFPSAMVKSFRVTVTKGSNLDSNIHSFRVCVYEFQSKIATAPGYMWLCEFITSITHLSQAEFEALQAKHKG